MTRDMVNSLTGPICMHVCLATFLLEDVLKGPLNEHTGEGRNSYLFFSLRTTWVVCLCSGQDPTPDLWDPVQNENGRPLSYRHSEEFQDRNSRILVQLKVALELQVLGSCLDSWSLAKAWEASIEACLLQVCALRMN